MVSNCNRTKGAELRWNYVQRMMKAGLSVHLFGGCSENKDLEFEKQPAAYKNSFKFYLAFENTINCTDYLTEKFWNNAVLARRVPVIWGPSKANLETLVPAKSFIHSSDFSNPEELARYLTYLHGNITAYKEYFNWRLNQNGELNNLRKLYVDRTIREEDLCRKLSSPFKRKSIPSIKEYLYNEPDECLNYY